ncbi:hypothetical protein SISNIDRAFT_487438 [Sistotremastrum niveocremeum HHB9708]|uniref:DUF6532 domain-containing protein n=1 Tax=Sistotremastrum niveocremeum HHB9708 TaxID=1314777 RepID=A0A164SGM7_9AGAM|nr:hypothetical protein SISNIDRAFT_487438 [Sistotremastrum niveocremeum HHB9708]
MAKGRSKSKSKKSHNKSKKDKAAQQVVDEGAQTRVDPATMALLQQLATSVGSSSASQTGPMTRSALAKAANKSNKGTKVPVDSNSDSSSGSSSGSDSSSSGEEGEEEEIDFHALGRLAPRGGDDDGHSSSRSKRTHEDSDGEVGDDDDDGPPSPTRRKTTAAAQHSIVIGPRKEVVPRPSTSSRNSQLRASRTGAGQSTTATPSTISGPITPNQRTPSPDPDNAMNVDVTPFKKNKFNDSRPQTGHLTPPSGRIGKQAISQFEAMCMCQGGFLSSTVEIKLAVTCLSETLRRCRESEGKDSKYAHREIRFNQDEVYKESMISLLRKRLPTTRGTIRATAAGLVSASYGLGKYDSDEEVKTVIAKLLKHGAFTFLDPDNPVTSRNTVYRNPAIVDLIGQEWFTGPTSSAVRYHEIFKPMPIPLIALASTSLECALTDYLSGNVVPASSNPFLEGMYRPILKKHLHNLNMIAENSPDVMKALQTSLYSKCWRRTGLAVEEDDETLLEVFIDVSSL